MTVNQKTNLGFIILNNTLTEITCARLVSKKEVEANNGNLELRDGTAIYLFGQIQTSGNMNVLVVSLEDSNNARCELHFLENKDLDSAINEVYDILTPEQLETAKLIYS